MTNPLEEAQADSSSVSAGAQDNMTLVDHEVLAQT